MNTKTLNLSGKEKLTMISNLATMLKAGIPILEAVDSLREDSKGTQKKLLETLSADLMQGKRVNYSFARFPKIFDKVVVNVIKASEDAGTLDVTLADLKSNIKRDMEFSDKIKGALIYPVFILIVFLAISLMILTVVIPKIKTVFGSMNIVLPLPTKVMIFLSNLVLQHTAIISIITLAICITLFMFYKKERKQILNLFSKLPLISDLTKKIDVSRFSRTLHLLLSSGLPINTSLELAQDVVMRKDVHNAIKHITETVLAGKKMSIGLKDNKQIFPSILIKITEAGEKTGTLDSSMQDASDYMDYEVDNTLKTVTTLIEPLMLMFVGLLVGGMIMSIISPIYGMIGQLGGQR